MSCRPRAGVEAARAVPRGRGLRFVVPAGTGRVTVDVFAQSRGRLVLGERRVLRTRGRTWSGRGARDGVHVVRFRDARGRTARVALERRDGRFRPRAGYAIAPGCPDIARLKLERPVFGGVRNRALGIAFRLGSDARAEVVVLRGGRVVRRFAARDVVARRLVRLRLPSEGIGRGEVVVRLRVVVAGGRVAVREVRSRRL